MDCSGLADAYLIGMSEGPNFDAAMERRFQGSVPAQFFDPGAWPAEPRHVQGSRQELCVAVRHRRTKRQLDVGLPYLPWDTITSGQRETPDGQRQHPAVIFQSAAPCRRASDSQHGWPILT
jgi:hypothetical protein